MSSSLRRGTGEHRALIVVDVQNDFCEGGSLAVTGGAEVARRITEHVLAHANEYDTIVATADWHDDPGGHFAEHPDFVDSWPPHCRIGTDGALFHPAAEPAFQHVEAIFRKGNHAAAYLSLIHISEPTRRTPISYAVFCLKKKNKQNTIT